MGNMAENFSFTYNIYFLNKTAIVITFRCESRECDYLTLVSAAL